MRRTASIRTPTPRRAAPAPARHSPRTSSPPASRAAATWMPSWGADLRKAGSFGFCARFLDEAGPQLRVLGEGRGELLRRRRARHFRAFARERLRHRRRVERFARRREQAARHLARGSARDEKAIPERDLVIG